MIHISQAQYLKEFAELNAIELELTRKKNSDYAGEGDAFLNFNLIEIVTGGKITAEMGMLVRLSDKFQRIANLLFREAQVADEKIVDTLSDNSVYSKIMQIYLQQKKAQSSETKIMPGVGDC